MAPHLVLIWRKWKVDHTTNRDFVTGEFCTTYKSKTLYSSNMLRILAMRTFPHVLVLFRNLLRTGVSSIRGFPCMKCYDKLPDFRANIGLCKKYAISQIYFSGFGIVFDLHENWNFLLINAKHCNYILASHASIPE